VGPGPSTIAGHASGLLHVRLLCGFLTTAVGTVTIQHNSPTFIAGNPEPIPNPFTFSIQGQIAPGATYDLRLDATYKPTATSARVLYETNRAHPDPPPIAFYYDSNPNVGFEHRLGGVCGPLSDNPSYLKLSLRANMSISSCRFQASWDDAELPCPQYAVDALNAHQEIVINTDYFAVDPSTCVPFIPTITPHLATGAPGFMRIFFDVGGATYARRVDFVKN
jgi:hypothetical protein